jgi:GNAT superfamily N-acetyltransferase
MYCLKNKGEIIGTIDLYGSEIKGFYIHSNHIREGLGTILINYIETKAKKKGIKKIRLECNQSAVGFYLKKGYIIKKKKSPSGKMIKRIIYVMEKELK